MKKAIFFIGLLFAVLGALAQHPTYSVNTTTINDFEFIDILAKGNEQEPASFKAIRLWVNDGISYDLELIGTQLSITQAQVQATLAKADWYYSVAPMGGNLRIIRKADTSMNQVYELVKTLLVGDYAYKFYSYTASTKRATP